MACLFVYGRAPDGFLIADDYTVIGSFWGKGPGYLLGLLTSDEIGGVWAEKFIRPVRPWSLALDGWIWGLEPPGFPVFSSQHSLDARDAYYAERVIREGVNRLALFQDAFRGAVGYRYFVVPANVYRDHPRKPLFQVVGACCRAYYFEEFYLFDLEPLSSSIPPP